MGRTSTRASARQTGAVVPANRIFVMPNVVMKIDILTLFPEICRAPLSESIMKRAQENKVIDLQIHDLRHWTTDKHHVVDDAPFGGGQGMVMKPEPIFAAVEALRERTSGAEHPARDIELQKPIVIFMSPAGKRLDQKLAAELSRSEERRV